MLVYVDDIIVTGSSSAAVQTFIAALSSAFLFRDLGWLNAKISPLLPQFPPQVGPALAEPFSDPTRYCQVVGSLQYVTLTRPDLAFAVNRFCQYIHPPQDCHWEDVKRILRYLQSTKDLGMVIRPMTILSLFCLL
ncbi:hypothetical protein LIER_42530 [Lithospermum erythrorhizon]|uniref:Uncharacterized protein n=1 Tax=Lithospermum erythrorhizon TaxID=34254 RepID=A0AAV3NHF3_LITER